MGAALRATDPDLLDRYLGLAEEVSGLPIGRLCAEGPPDVLRRTDVSQPAILAVSLAMGELARTMGVEPAFVAGHSLGEWTAAVVAGALAAEDGMRLVAHRGRLMAACQAERAGTMAAVIGLPGDAVATFCDAAGEAVVANRNTPTQTVVSGAVEAVERVCELGREAGGRAIPLDVGGAFHSPQMVPVRAALATAAGDVSWRQATVPIAANALAGLVSSAEMVRSALVMQVAEPVDWVRCIRSLLDAGCTRFLELGPGRVLAGLVRAIDRSATVASAESRAELEIFLG
jgi:[acyl-carrier-protein] S-malonyltransferase